MGQFTIDLGYIPTSPVNVLIFDALGQQIDAFTMTETTKQVSLSNYADGVYMVRITNGGYVKAIRMIVQ